jgi:hypothetical protein
MRPPVVPVERKEQDEKLSENNKKEKEKGFEKLKP